MLKKPREEVILPEWQKLIGEITCRQTNTKLSHYFRTLRPTCLHRVPWVKNGERGFTV